VQAYLAGHCADLRCIGADVRQRSIVWTEPERNNRSRCLHCCGDVSHQFGRVNSTGHWATVRCVSYTSLSSSSPLQVIRHAWTRRCLRIRCRQRGTLGETFGLSVVTATVTATVTASATATATATIFAITDVTRVLCGVCIGRLPVDSLHILTGRFSL
jgi:hypothetical protein